MKTLNRILSVAVSLGLLFLSSPPGFAQKNGDRTVSEEEMDVLFDALEKGFEADFTLDEKSMENLWAKMEKEEAEQWAALEKDVLEKWEGYRQSSKTKWVEYSGERDALSQVDFEDGTVLIEAVIPASAMSPFLEAKKLINQQIKALVGAQDSDGRPLMSGMLSKETLKSAASNKMGAKMDPKPFVGKDGIKRIKVKIEMPMVPDHMKRRARRYTDLVTKHALKRGLDPALVMAVMHTESAFNPMARSSAPAFGLMQLVPRFAAKEAYQQLYGVEKILSPSYLYKPENNIELGVIYLARLDEIYFKDIRDPTKRRYIAICAYNWGPTAMRNRFIKRLNVPIEEMDADGLFKLLQKRVPNETKAYLRRVEKRRVLYRS